MREEGDGTVSYTHADALAEAVRLTAQISGTMGLEEMVQLAHCGAAFSALARELREAESAAKREDLHVIFDAPPGPTCGRFVECETAGGRSVGVGEWVERPDGLWALVLPNAMIEVSR